MNCAMSCLRLLDLGVRKYIIENRRWIKVSSWMITLKHSDKEVTIIYDPNFQKLSVLVPESEYIEYVSREKINQHVHDVLFGANSVRIEVLHVTD